jgi:hypothetical protein
MAKKLSRRQVIARPFETDYAGAWKGHCLTRENAIIAAMRHVVLDGYSRATITDLRNGQVVARIRMDEEHKLKAIVDVVKPFRKVR